MRAWSVEQDELLKRMASEGYSASLIGAQMGKSRNAVIGRAARLSGVQLGGNTKGGKKVPRARGEAKPRRSNGTYRIAKPARPVAGHRKKPFLWNKDPKPPTIYSEPADDVGTKELWQLDLRHECTWPVGDPKQPGFLYCGATDVPVERVPHYCLKHLWRACPTHADLRNA